MWCNEVSIRLNEQRAEREKALPPRLSQEAYRLIQVLLEEHLEDLERVPRGAGNVQWLLAQEALLRTTLSQIEEFRAQCRR